MKIQILVALLLLVAIATASWDAYIDSLIAKTKDASGDVNCDRAAIIGKNGGAYWTSADHANALKLQGTEAADIAKAFQLKDFDDFQKNGIHAEGIKYAVLLVEDDKKVYAKSTSNGAIVLRASQTAIVIGHVQKGGQHEDLGRGVGFIADYLEQSGM